MDTVEQGVRKVVAKQIRGVTDEQMTREASLVKDLGADSLDLEMIRCDLEERFKVHITDETVAKVQTIGDAIDVVSFLLTTENQ